MREHPAQGGAAINGVATGLAGPGAVDILLVDDNPAKLMAMESVLAPLGQRVVKAHSGTEALRALLARDFATIILDVNMPDIDGFETARMIRSRAKSASTPIIFVSAINTDETDAFRGYGLGAVDYILAPIVPEILRAKVSVFVELHRRTKEAQLHAERLEQRTRELEASQRELRLAERMATVGTLCAGLGHDMGNLLLPIAIWLDGLDDAGLTPDVRDGVGNIRSCVEYLRRLSSGLRQLALDPHRSEPGHTAVTEWGSEIGPVLHSALPRGVLLQVELPPSLPSVRLPRHLLTQVVFNLVQNAGDAMGARANGLVRVTGRADSDHGIVILEVEDNGPGMPREVLDRCLDPFFSTKTRTTSTGLGLSLVNAIVRNAGGAVEVKSALGEGTTFALHLPAAVSETRGRVPAAVTLKDPRERGYAVSILRSAGFEMFESPEDIPSGAAVWIAEAAKGIEAKAQRFEGESAGRRVLLVGKGASGRGLEGGRELHGGLNALAEALSEMRSELASHAESPVSRERP